ncbi:MAG: hypothetical protein N2C14_14105, partial [Planctomycetales bacterium]
MSFGRFAVLLSASLLVRATLAANDFIEKPAVLGPVKVSVRLEPKEPLIGDVVKLIVRAEAEKDVELLMPAFGEALDRFEVIDFVPRRSVDDQGRTVATQTYRLQPASSGPQAVPPILIEFVDRRPGKQEAPKDQDAYEILTDRIDFTVQSVLPDDAEADLKPPLGKLEPLAPPPVSRWPWLIALLVAAGSLVPWMVKAIAAYRRRSRRRSAYEIARVRLDRLLAKPTPEAGDVGPFFVELSAIVRQYLEDRF